MWVFYPGRIEICGDAYVGLEKPENPEKSSRSEERTNNKLNACTGTGPLFVTGTEEKAQKKKRLGYIFLVIV